MSNPTVRISPQAHRVLKDLAAQSGQAMQDILEQAIEEESRRRFIEQANASYARLREDPRLWQEVLDERAAWDLTLNDGLPMKVTTTRRQARK